MDKNGCMVDKIGHFPNIVETIGHTRVFRGQNRATVDPSFIVLPFTRHSSIKYILKDGGVSEGPYVRFRQKKTFFAC